MPRTFAGSLVLIAAPLVVLAYRDGPPAKSTGGFGERTCQGCHMDNPLNAEGGKLEVTGIPEAYVPGETYRITVTISRADLMRGGFQMTSRFADGKQAGAWRATDRLRARVSSPEAEPRIQFVQHNGMGSTAPSPGANTWTVEWTAPNANPVQFHIAANATNDDASPLGDFIYTAEFRSAPRQ